MTHTPPCECAVRFEDGVIVYCPTHAEAPNMAEALRGLLELFPGHDAAKRLAERFGLDLRDAEKVEYARAILARIDGEEK